MHSVKGFLSPAGPTRPHRLTESQRDAVVRAVTIAVERQTRQLPDQDGTPRLHREALAFAQKFVIDALRNYPLDRSCLSCDFERDSYCLHWKQPIPTTSLDGGCDHHQVHGAPF